MSLDGDGEPDADDIGFLRVSEAGETGCFRMSSKEDGTGFLRCLGGEGEADDTDFLRFSEEEDTDCPTTSSAVSADDGRELWNSAEAGVLEEVVVASEGRSAATRSCSQSGL